MIQKAEQNDIASITQSYIELFSYESEHGSYTNWISGLYPSERTAQKAFQDGNLYVLKENGLSICRNCPYASTRCNTGTTAIL